MGGVPRIEGAEMRQSCLSQQQRSQRGLFRSIDRGIGSDSGSGRARGRGGGVVGYVIVVMGERWYGSRPRGDIIVLG